MKLVTKANDIKSALKDISPSKIAVAYVGDNWDEYIDPNQIKEIILSPTIGSNPIAIEEIVEKIGYENIFFLDSLHAKFYLGSNSALLGSCNLSNNGMSGLSYEAALVINDSEIINKLNVQFDEYKKLAQITYPNEESKIAQIKKLKKLRELENREGRLNDKQAITKIEDYKFRVTSKFHLLCCIFGDIEVTQDENYPKESFNDYVNLKADENKIFEGEWILLCYFEDTEFTDIAWLYVDKLLPNRVAGEEDHSLLAVTLEGKVERTQPFILEDKESAIAILNTPDYLSLLKNDNFLIPDEAVTIDFVKKLKKLTLKNTLR